MQVKDIENALKALEERIVNVSSGAASMWLRNQDEATKNLFTSSDTTFEELQTAVEGFAPTGMRP